MARRHKGNPDEAITRELVRVSFSDGGPTLTAEQLSVMEDLLCVNGQLPPEFRAFLLRQNGGDPSPSAFPWRHPDGGRAGLEPGRDPRLDLRAADRPVARHRCIRMTLKLRDELPAWAIVIGNADRDDWLLTFEDGPREGEIWIKYWDEVPLPSPSRRTRRRASTAWPHHSTLPATLERRRRMSRSTVA